MPTFKIKNTQLVPIKEIKIDLEKDIQSVTENNLQVVFGLKFISSEFSLQNFRIDTLAFDEEAKSFVIIEYKKDRSFSVVDQGFSYLSLMLNNKSDFVLEYNENVKDNLKREDIDWSQSKILFIAGSFTSHQRNAINFKDLPIELWEVKKFSNNTILFNLVRSLNARESIKTISKSKIIDDVGRQIKTYTIDDHIKPSWKETRSIYEELSERILAIDQRFEESPQKYYIGYKIENSVIVALKTRKSKIVLELNRTQPKDVNDPEKKVKYRKNSLKYYNKHISQYNINSLEDIDYGMSLIKQVYNKFAK